MNSAPIVQLANPLELLEHYVDLVQKDLAAGKVESVVQHLRTICVIGAHLELQLRQETMDVDPAAAESQDVLPSSLQVGRPPSDRSLKLTNSVVQELRRAGRPVQVQELMARIKRRGVDVPGKGTSANLIAHLRRMPNVRRVARGLYTLVE